MKGRFTRLNKPAASRYSEVFHHEGEMITAADLNDHGLIAAARTNTLGDDKPSRARKPQPWFEGGRTSGKVAQWLAGELGLESLAPQG